MFLTHNPKGRWFKSSSRDQNTKPDLRKRTRLFVATKCPSKVFLASRKARENRSWCRSPETFTFQQPPQREHRFPCGASNLAGWYRPCVTVYLLSPFDSFPSPSHGGRASNPVPFHSIRERFAHGALDCGYPASMETEEERGTMEGKDAQVSSEGAGEVRDDIQGSPPMLVRSACRECAAVVRAMGRSDVCCGGRVRPAFPGRRDA